MRPCLYLPWLLLLLVACSPDAIHDEDELQLGDNLESVHFEAPQDFETGSYPDIGAALSIEDGRYIIEQSASTATYLWGQGGSSVQDVAVTAQAEALNDFEYNLYGVMCRVDAAGAGYAFLISSDGYAGIARSNGSSLSFLVDWRETDAVNRGQAVNTVQGICIGDYLALYVNDRFVADVEDSRITGAGQVGLIAGLLHPQDDSATVRVAFDELRLQAASLR